MNKELIKKYKKEFDHWLNGGKLLACPIRDKLNGYSIDWQPIDENALWDNKNIAYIINDKYVEFRKAGAEGKQLQVSYNDGKTWFDKSYRKISWSKSQLVRIKPEESKFKLGDWFRAPSGCIYQINETDILHGTEHFIPWQPKPGEWCWFYSKEIKQEHIGTHWAIPSLGQFKSKTETGVETIEGFLYLYCKPFIGELPSLLKDSNEHN